MEYLETNVVSVYHREISILRQGDGKTRRSSAMRFQVKRKLDRVGLSSP